MAATPPLLEDALFHCQQAAEKSLKAFLAFHDLPFRRTHSLEEIGEQCLAIDPSLQQIVDAAAPLSEYAWTCRYPGPYEAPTVEAAGDARAVALQAYEAVLKRLPPETHPSRS